MKILFVLFTLGFSFLVQAADRGYDLQIELSLNGKHISSPRLTLQEGKTSTITQDTDGKTTFIEVTAKERDLKNKKAIDMQFVIGTINANGKKTITNSPNIITLENQKAEMTVGENTAESLSLGVTASRIAL